MTVQIEWEPLSVLLDDGLADLVREHWLEVGVHKEEMPLAVDWEKYHSLEDQKILMVMGARIDGRLIGYSSFFYLPHLHYNTTQLAGCDAIFVKKELRRTGAGLGLIDKAEKDFMAKAAPNHCRITYHDREGIELLGPVLRKRGYVKTDTTYSLIVRAQ